MVSATNENTIRKAKERQKADAKVEAEVIRHLMSTVNGRRWLWLNLAFAQIFVATEELDPQRLAYNEARRNSGLRLLTAINSHAPDLYFRMVQENSSANLEENSNDGHDSSDGHGLDSGSGSD